MDNTPFAVAIAYEGKKTLVIVQEILNPLNRVFRVKFPDGKTIEINTYEPEEDNQSGWAIDAEESQLAKEIGSAIDEKEFKGGRFYIEPFATRVNDKDYLIMPEYQEADEERVPGVAGYDELFLNYAIYEDGHFRFYLQKDEHWIADVKGIYMHVDEALVEKLGNFIEEHYQLA